MRKVLGVTLPLALAMSLVVGTASAQSQPASKAAVQVANTTLIGQTGTATPPGVWVGLLSATIKTSQQKDLFVGVSLECGLFTETLVRSKSGTSDTSKAEAIVTVRVLVDGVPAEPGVVNFCSRSQTLMAQFGGTLNCADLNGDGVITLNECTLTAEQLDLILDTMQANAFNFALADVGVGVHKVEVQARLDFNQSFQQGTTSARATIGKGSVTVEEVRLVKGVDITL